MLASFSKNCAHLYNMREEQSLLNYGSIIVDRVQRDGVLSKDKPRQLELQRKTVRSGSGELGEYSSRQGGIARYPRKHSSGWRNLE